MIGNLSAAVFTPGAVLGDYESIATVSLSSSQSSITFTNIPSDYQHLQIRGILRANNASGDENARLKLNGNLANYFHQISGNGTSASAGNYTNYPTNSIWFSPVISNSNTSNVFTGFIMDILDYKNTNKTKVVRTLTGWDANGSGRIILASTFFDFTSAVTSITLEQWNTGGWVANSFAALYGIKG